MREIAPGDVIFSYADATIKAIGIANSHAYDAPKPVEFAEAGAYWDRIGWRVDVGFMSLTGPIRPREYMDVLRPLLLNKYAPLRPNGDGLQSVYLTYLPESLAGALIDLCGREARDIVRQHQVSDAELPAIVLTQWEEHEMEQLRQDKHVSQTQREALIMARRGQGLFKQRVMLHEKACRITKVDRIRALAGGALQTVARF